MLAENKDLNYEDEMGKAEVDADLCSFCRKRNCLREQRGIAPQRT